MQSDKMKMIDNKNDNESNSRNDNKNEIKHKKAASAKNKEKEMLPVRCGCANCQESPTNKHSAKCCFLPNKPRSTPFDKSVCGNKRCEEYECVFFAYELWKEVTPELVGDLLSCCEYKHLRAQFPKTEDIIRMVATEFPSYKLDGMFVPNSVAKQTNSAYMLFFTMSIGFKYDVDDQNFISKIVMSHNYAKPFGEAPKGWTEKFEKSDPDFAFQLTRMAFYISIGHFPNVVKGPKITNITENITDTDNDINNNK